MSPRKGPDPSAAFALLRRGSAEIIREAELRAKLALGRPLIVKAGFDPTAPDLHLGHTVLLRKLRQFQDLGHTVVFLIGDATATIGDPSGQSKTRKLMPWEEIEANARTYEAQVSTLLKTDDPRRFQRRHNSEWFGKGRPFGLKEMVELTSRYTVARLIERDDFQKRLKAGQEISLLELFYPLLQGYDSVMLQADVEMGGTDQTFNLLVGRDLQRAYGQEPQVVMTLPLLEGTDGIQKMSKSLGNHIGITEPPEEMFGRLMSIPDTLIVKYFTLLTDVSAERIETLTRQLAERAINPRDAKVELATTIVGQYHGPRAAREAREAFAKVFSRRELPDDIPTYRVPSPGGDDTVDLVTLLVGARLAKTKNEARRLLRQGGVKLGGAVVRQPSVPVAWVASAVLQVGPRRFRRLVAGP